MTAPAALEVPTEPVAAADPAVAAPAAVVEPVAPVVAPKFVLTLPDKSSLDPSIIERTAAHAAKLGLSSNDTAQGLLDFVHQESQAIADQAAARALESHAPGGAEWESRNTQWRADSLADPMLGAGDQGKLDVAVALATRALAKYGDDPMREFLNTSGLGSHPAVLRLFVKIGQAMSEPAFRTPGTSPTGTPTDAPKTEEEVAAKMFPSMAKQAPAGV